ncbi:MAG: amidohydrolase, partial [Acidimicrobiales bacterium]
MSSAAGGASTALKDAARSTIQSAAPGLEDLSHRIHAHPELGFEEELSSAWVAEALAAAGFNVDIGVAGLPTA